MVVALIRNLALMLILAVLGACSEEKCTTCSDEIETLFMCTAGYSEPLVSGPDALLGITASFIGSPVPNIRSFRWMGLELERIDEGLPIYDKGMPGEYLKQMPIVMVVETDTISFELTVPDPFHLIQPTANTSVISAQVPLDLVWSNSTDAERYSLKIYILSYEIGGMTIELDTTFYTSDTTATIPAEYLKVGRQIILMPIAVWGVPGDPGDVVNFSHKDMRGFLSSGYKALGLTAFIQ